MHDEREAGSKLISDIVFLTQRASAETCEVAARTIERQTTRFLAKNPGDIKNAYAFELTSEKLCECIKSLANVAPGVGNEILTKRRALDLLLALSNELEHSDAPASLEDQEPTIIFARTG